MIINELYHNIDGKYVKDTSNLYHYTSIEAFHKIVKSFLSGKGLKGSQYAANLNKDSNEICLVRSDRTPDFVNVDMSGNVGDIKFTFKEDALKNKFGKAKPIQEFQIQATMNIYKYLKNLDKYFYMKPPIVIKSIDKIKKDYFKMSLEEFENLKKKLSMYLNNNGKKELEFIERELKIFHSKKEKMESRVKLPEGKYITLDLINKIYLPSYLKNDKEIKEDINKLKEKGFNNIVYYNCKYPKDYDSKKYFNY